MAKPFKIKTQDIAVAGIFLSFILVFMLVPFNTFGVNMAFIPLIAVCLAATVKGFWMGLAMGIAFGVASLVGSYIHPDLTAPMFHNPLVSVLPRVFIPITVHFSFRFVKWLLRNKRDDLSTGAASVVSTMIGVCTNTLLVLSMMALRYFNRSFGEGDSAIQITGAFFTGVITTNFIAEIIICTAITPVICTAVRIALGVDKKGAPIAEHASAAAPLEEVTALPQEQEDEGVSFEKEQRDGIEKTSEDTEEKQ